MLFLGRSPPRSFHNCCCSCFANPWFNIGLEEAKTLLMVFIRFCEPLELQLLNLERCSLALVSELRAPAAFKDSVMVDGKVKLSSVVS